MKGGILLSYIFLLLFLLFIVPQPFVSFVIIRTLLAICFKSPSRLLAIRFILPEKQNFDCTYQRKIMSQVCKAETACAACKFQRKKCSEKCVLAPYFPQNDPDKFMLVHRLFGNGHVVKLLQDLPAEQRGDAVSSLVYEAKARVADPVHGCVALINDLHKKLEEAQSQLASAQAKLDNMSAEQCNMLSTLINTGYYQGWDTNFCSTSAQESDDTQYTNLTVSDDVVNSLALWDTNFDVSPF